MKDVREIISDIRRDQWIFAGIIALLALAAWFSFYLIVYEVLSGAGAWIFSILTLLALATSVGLSFFLLVPPRLAIATYAVISLIAFLFFGWSSSEVFAVLALFIATFLGHKFVMREYKNSISFMYLRFLRRGLPIFFTGLAFALALFYNASPIGRISEVPQLSQGVVDASLVPAEYIIRTFAPEFRRDIKIYEISGLNVSGFAGPIIKTYFANLPEDEQTKTTIEFFQNFINDQLRATILPYKKFLPFIYIFGLFLVFRAFAMPIMWLAILMGWIVMKILMKIGILELNRRKVEKEELVL